MSESAPRPKFRKRHLRNLLGWRLAYSARAFLNKRPGLYYGAAKLMKRGRTKQVDQNIDCVITGIWGCANTFVSAAFQHWNPDVNLSHHQHVPAQAMRAAEYKLPMLILIRNPVDALASLTTRFAYELSNRALAWELRDYADYYESIIDLSDSFVAADFREVIKDFPSPIKRLNDKFGTSFISPDPQTQEYKDFSAKYKWSEENSAQSSEEAEQGLSASQWSSDFRVYTKEEVKEAIYAPELDELRNRAEKIYERFCEVKNIPVNHSVRANP